ncbi:hypothetical protein FA10DRAFT_261025 [Acaromyces ingoldii]|uniref:Uncharacterized protein n=1 Tax=Acaromyces ingoldii TaxID=215250 RepID=A0A316YKI9_9BASI|nr:hypothetical protein FA10DRAFT_261025 [Acaromyces ingoldii]PWN89148.1 hypothetical protein FA10DRAFT_261025 [Acaromyces ingoldii]
MAAITRFAFFYKLFALLLLLLLLTSVTQAVGSDDEGGSGGGSDDEVEITTKSNQRIKDEQTEAQHTIVASLKDHFIKKPGSSVSRDSSGSSSLDETTVNPEIFELNRSFRSSSLGDDSGSLSDSTFGFQSEPVSDGEEELETPPHRHSGSRKSSSPSSLKKVFRLGKSKLFKGGGSGSSN